MRGLAEEVIALSADTAKAFAVLEKLETELGQERYVRLNQFMDEIEPYNNSDITAPRTFNYAKRLRKSFSRNT